MPDDAPIVAVPAPHPDDLKAVIEITFGVLLTTAIHSGILARPAVFQDMDEWLGPQIAGDFKTACALVLLKLGSSLPADVKAMLDRRAAAAERPDAR